MSLTKKIRHCIGSAGDTLAGKVVENNACPNNRGSTTVSQNVVKPP